MTRETKEVSPFPVARSDTKTRILSTALDLFNLEGEGEVSAVDIASVLGISPGNLYYHYRGKEPIVAELFSDFATEIKQVLSAPIREPLRLSDNWVYLYIIFEEIWDFRFFYRDPAGLIARIPDLAQPFARLLALKEATAETILSDLENLGALGFNEGERDALARRLAQHFTVWIPYRQLRSAARDEEASSIINEGVHQSILMIAPYLAGDMELFAEGLETARRAAPGQHDI